MVGLRCRPAHTRSYMFAMLNEATPLAGCGGIRKCFRVCVCVCVCVCRHASRRRNRAVQHPVPQRPLRLHPEGARGTQQGQVQSAL